jgi:hypothetical protein
MSGVLAAHEQTSKWPAAPSGQASHVSTQPEALAGWLPVKNTTPKHTKFKEKKRERERGGRGGEKAWGKQGRQDQRIRKT